VSKGFHTEPGTKPGLWVASAKTTKLIADLGGAVGSLASTRIASSTTIVPADVPKTVIGPDVGLYVDLMAATRLAVPSATESARFLVPQNGAASAGQLTLTRFQGGFENAPLSARPMVKSSSVVWPNPPTMRTAAAHADVAGRAMSMATTRAKRTMPFEPITRMETLGCQQPSGFELLNFLEGPSNVPTLLSRVHACI
jgi:hypothetical protein